MNKPSLSQALFSSNRTDWATPDDLFRLISLEFPFELDVCATPENAKCTRYFTAQQDALTQDWENAVCWMNPPYGREISRWMEKAFHESRRGATVVCLVPARTDTAWWHKYAVRGEVRFLRGRIRFVGANHPAPFPNALVIFRPPVSWSPHVPE